MCQVTYNLAVNRAVLVCYQGQQYVVQEHCWFDVVLVKQFRYCVVRASGVGPDSYANQQLSLVLLQDESCW
jgi:hypothetical protein